MAKPHNLLDCLAPQTYRLWGEWRTVKFEGGAAGRHQHEDYAVRDAKKHAYNVSYSERKRLERRTLAIQAALLFHTDEKAIAKFAKTTPELVREAMLLLKADGKVIQCGESEWRQAGSVGIEDE